ncbi:MAG TPA: SDR family oxidoreductase, partial [Beijerinckiaceae bacterium]|nr:SDR family oxidoreductase [Beijerinckiaceae bacterium]
SYAITLIVNCVGILQDGPGGDTQSAHGDFVAHLLRALGKAGRPVPLIHISIPGEPADERTAFSITKRKADDLIAASGAPYAILRPGFVIAPAAFGGSALVRALAASPFDLPEVERARPFPAIGIADLADTVARLADRWNGGAWSDADWDVMHPDQTTVAAVIAAHRRWLGTSSRRRITLPAGLLNVGAWAADLAGWLGWRPPIRSTALAELRRGVRGDPGPWLAATGLEPRPLVGVLREMPATVQERWFARLYIMKGLIIPSLVVFWVVSGLIALTAYPAAVGILTSHGFSPALAHVTTVLSSLLDIGVGLAIAHRRTCRMGLRVGIAVSLFYMAGAALITPELWIEPLGALVKTGPAIVLMLVALAVLDER